MLRPVFVYALAATLAIVAGEVVRRGGEARPPEPAIRRSRTAAAAAPPEGPPVLPPAPAPSPPPRAARAPTPAPEEPQDAPGIPADVWRPPRTPDAAARPSIDDVWPEKAPASGGARVQLRGRNLDPVVVLFGRSPARILAVDRSHADVVLTLAAPARTGPAQVWIVVTNRDGSNAIGAEPFQYYQ
jgi:hypothetical protein